MADKKDEVLDPKEYDLLPKLIPHFDRHLIFPMLQFMLDNREDYDELEVKTLIFSLLKGTSMTDYVCQLEMEIKNLDSQPPQYAKMHEEYVKQRTELENQTEKLRELLEDEQVTGNLRSDKVANLNYLKETHGVTGEEVAALYDYGQCLYNMGDYDNSAQLLYQFRVLSTDNERLTAANWGKLACEILHANWDTVVEEIPKVRESIDQRFFNAPLQQLHQRTWLLHWALFPLFHSETSRDTLIELFFQPVCINSIQTSSPWLLRYLAAAVVAQRSKGGGTRTGSNSSSFQKQLKDLVRVVRQEGYEYSDPVTEFLRALYVEFDFEEAQRRLSQAETILRNDFFTEKVADAFVESARHLISESYCKIHQRIDIKDLSTRLGLSQSDGEKWIVNLIRDTRVDAKIDYKEGTVVMNHPPQSVYQQVIERTKGGFFRTQVLSAAVAK